MSKERELLERWLDDTILEPEELDSLMEETRELLAQPEQITFKDEADKIAHLEKSVELLIELLDAKKYQPVNVEDELSIFEESEFLWVLEYKVRELKMQKMHSALEVGNE